jgi:hypothetical protein
VTLIVSAIAYSRVIADENGEVHYWTSSSSYVPADEEMTNAEAMPVGYNDDMTPVAMASPLPAYAGHVYLVNDDPGYDLSGPYDHWFLVGDGTAFREDSWHGNAAFAARVGNMPHEVVPITAEFRQDWLAVAAGDRPVRTFTAPRSSMNSGVMVSSGQEVYVPPPENQMASTQSRDTFRPVSQPRRRAAYHPTRRPRYTGEHYTATSTASYASNEPAVNVETENAVTAKTAVEVMQDQSGNELYQINTSWYMKQNGDWYRAESWRGPFVRLGKGKVPREVRMSAKHPSRMEMNAD